MCAIITSHAALIIAFGGLYNRPSEFGDKVVGSRDVSQVTAANWQCTMKTAQSALPLCRILLLISLHRMRQTAYNSSTAAVT